MNIPKGLCFLHLRVKKSGLFLAPETSKHTLILYQHLVKVFNNVDKSSRKNKIDVAGVQPEGRNRLEMNASRQYSICIDNDLLERRQL